MQGQPPLSFSQREKGEKNMRLDKYLKVARIIKRRTLANDACDGENVSVNGKRAKASYEVKVGDVIEVNLGQRTIRLRVKDISPHVQKTDAAALYEILE